MSVLENMFCVFLVLAANLSPSATLSSNTSDNSVAADIGLGTRVAAVIGSMAELPCDTQLPTLNDTMELVMWYINDSPVYSYDARAEGLTSHWMIESLKGRAQWVGLPTSVLQLKDVQRQDRGMYRCSVAFQISPTKNGIVRLDVVELPSEPVIYDTDMKQVINITRPYNEGDDFNLICTVFGGNPVPNVLWLQDDKVIATLDPSEIQQQVGSRTLPLNIWNASRSLLSSVFSCIADNTVLAIPRRTSIRIDLYLRPARVQIDYVQQPFYEGREKNVTCRATGARPPAILTWWFGGKQLSPFKEDLEDSNNTLSVVRWTPHREHDGMVLVCRAEHTKLHLTMVNKLPMIVYYAPVATIQLGAVMNPNDIEEGDDVYFECSVDANPLNYKVLWEHNGNQLVNNPSRGVIVNGNMNLALRNVSRRQAGMYTCIASNVVGSRRSNSLPLHIIFRPVCYKKESTIVGTALQESKRLTCVVKAHPPPDSFQWFLNNSEGVFRIDADRYTVEAKEHRSVLTFTPKVESDYGTLSCRATNLAGQQTDPCIYNLVPINRPDPTGNCTISNLTHDSLDFECFASNDGGLPCVYIVEVWSDGVLVTKSTNVTPTWTLKGLGAERKLRIITYAANARGPSDYTEFTVETAPKLQLQTEVQAVWSVNWILGGIIWGTLLASFIICVTFIYLKLKKTANNNRVTVSLIKTDKDGPKTNSAHPSEDHNPELIPLNTGVEDQLLEPPPPYALVSKAPGARRSPSAESLVQLPARTPIIAPAQPYDTPSDALDEIRLSYEQMKVVAKPHREVVTTRTPLLSVQESYV